MKKEIETERDTDEINQKEGFTRISRICEVDSEYNREVDTEQRKYRMVKAAVLKENGGIDRAVVIIAIDEIMTEEEVSAYNNKLCEVDEY